MKAVDVDKVSVMVLEPDVTGSKNGFPSLLLKAPNARHRYPFANFAFQLMRRGVPMFDAWVAVFSNHGKADEREVAHGNTDVEGGFIFNLEFESP